MRCQCAAARHRIKAVDRPNVPNKYEASGARVRPLYARHAHGDGLGYQLRKTQGRVMLIGGGDVWDKRDPRCRQRALVFNDHIAKFFSDRVAIIMPSLGLTLTCT